MRPTPTEVVFIAIHVISIFIIHALKFSQILYNNFFVLLLIVNYPALSDGASSPRGENFLLLPGNLLYTPLKRECIAEVPCPQALGAVPTPHQGF
jgi:hypothetical protein